MEPVTKYLAITIITIITVVAMVLMFSVFVVGLHRHDGRPHRGVPAA